MVNIIYFFINLSGSILSYLIFIIFIVILLIVFRIKLKPYYISYNTSLPNKSYTLIYTDEKTINKKKGVTYSTLLYSLKYDVTGKPDYIYKKGNKFYPIELKSASIGKYETPRQKDLMQLALYFILIEDIYGKVTKGYLIYKDVMFTVKNTRNLRRQVKEILYDMRQMLNTGEQEAKPSFINCKNCVCRATVCEYYES